MLFIKKYLASLVVVAFIGNSLIAQSNCSIGGEIENDNQQSIELQLFGDMIFPPSTIFHKTDGKGKFSFDLNLKASTYAVLKYASEEIPLFLESGDKIQLHFQSYEPFKTVKAKGKGAENLEVLWNCRRAFYPHRDNIVMHEMSRSEPESFLEYLNTTVQFRKTIWFKTDVQLKKKCSQGFLNFMMAELHYWKPYFALLYRKVKAASDGLNTTYPLHASFIETFFHTQINNEKAITHPYYTGFLEEYADWSSEYPKIATAIASNDNIATSLRSPISIFKDAECQKKLMEVHGCQPLVWLSQDTTKTTILPDGTLFSYSITTLDGVKGWVKTEDVQFLQQNLNHSDQVFENSVTLQKQVVRQCKVVMDNILVRKDASDYYAIDTLKKEEVVNYLNQKTDNTYNYYHQGEIFVDNFYKIKTNTGKVGWVMAGAVVLQEIEQEIPVEKFVVKSGTESDWMDLDHYFIGQPKCFLASKWLINRCLKQETKLLLRFLYHFSQNNPYPNYFKAVEEIYLNAYKTWYPNEPLTDVLPKYQGEMPHSDNCLFINEVPLGSMQEAVAYLPDKNISDYPEILAFGEGQKEIASIFWNGKNIALSEKNLEVPSDPWNIDSKDYPILNGTNKTLIPVPTDEVSIAELTLDGHKIPIWILKQDSLEIDWDGQADLKNFRIKGKKALFHQYIVEAYSKFRVEDMEAKASVRDKSPVEYKQMVEDLYLQKVFFWENHPVYHQLKGTNLDKMVRKELFYWKGYLLLNYPWEHPLLRQEEVPMSLDISWASFVQKTEIEPIDGFYSKNAANFYNLYNDWLGMHDQKNRLPSSVLHWLEAKEILLETKRKSQSDAIDFVDKSMKSKLLENYFQLWCRQLVRKLEKKEQAKAPNFKLEDVNGKIVQLSDLEGKVVVLDFWATYCSPCIASMNSQASTIEYWKNEPVVFVWVSIDKEKKVWEDFLNKNVVQGVHLWAGDSSQIKNDFKVWYLPTSLIIDKKGYIVPSDKNLTFNKTLEQLLNQ